MAEIPSRVARIDKALELAREFARSFDARYLGIALLVPVVEVFRRISYALPIALSQVVDGAWCIASLVAGLLLGAGVLVCAGLRRRSLPLRALCIGALAAGVLAAAGMTCGALAAEAFVGQSVGSGGVGEASWLAIGVAGGTSPSPALSVVVCASYLALGASVSATVVGWVAAFARIRTICTLIYVALAVLIGNLPQFALDALSNPLALGGVLFGCLIGSIAALAVTARTSEPPVADESGEAPDDHSLLGIVRTALGAPAVGLALAAFSWGVMAVPPQPYVTDHKAWVYLVGNLIALGVICAFAYSLRSGERFSVLRQKAFFLLPAFAVFLAYFSFIRMLDAGEGLKTLLSIGFNMGVGGVFSLFTATAAAQYREKGVRPELIAGPALIACTLSYALGAALFEVYGNTAMYFQVVLATLYILGLAFIASRRASLNDDSRLEERCQLAAQRRGLSQRECEVLQLIVAGYATDRIADELSISIETVRTHRKRIYAKLDVHRHDELMRAIRAAR